jgi:hypothetical protein
LFVFELFNQSQLLFWDRSLAKTAGGSGQLGHQRTLYHKTYIGSIRFGTDIVDALAFNNVVVRIGLAVLDGGLFRVENEFHAAQRIGTRRPAHQRIAPRFRSRIRNDPTTTTQILA